MENTSQANLKSAYAILSEQSYLRTQAVDRLKVRIKEYGDLDFNSDTFDGSMSEPAAVIAALNTLPFMSPHRLVIVNAIQDAPKMLLDELTAYLQNPSDTSVLCVVGSKLAKNTRLYRAIASVGQILDRKAPTKNDLPKTVESLFAAGGVTASRQALAALIEATGEDLDAINVAVNKVVAFVGPRRTVKPTDIAAVVPTTAEIKIWDLSSAVCQRDTVKAYKTYKRLINQGESEFPLHAMMVRTLRELIVARSLIDEGRGSAAILAAELGKPEWLARKTLESARLFTAREVRRGLIELSEIEFALKSGGNGLLLFEKWIIDFTKKAA